MPLDIYEDGVHRVAIWLTGEAGPIGTDALAFQIWMLLFGISPTSLREDMSEWSYWMDN